MGMARRDERGEALLALLPKPSATRRHRRREDDRHNLPGTAGARTAGPDRAVATSASTSSSALGWNSFTRSVGALGIQKTAAVV